MKENSVNASKSSWISKNLLKRVLAMVGAAMFSIAALTVTSSASAADWMEQESTPYLWFYPDYNKNEYQLLEVGDYIEYYLGEVQKRGLVLGCYTNLISGCTYEITYTVKYTNIDWDMRNLFIIPGDVENLYSDEIHSTLLRSGKQYTEDGQLINNLISVSTKTETRYEENANDTADRVCTVEYTINFSTAEGFIDRTGYNYLLFCLTYYDEHDYSEYGDPPQIYINVEDYSTKVMFDPGAEYFTNLVIERLNKTAAELDEVGGQLSEAENWLLDKAKEMKESVSDEWKSNLNTAAGLVSPARSGTSILQPLSTFGTIYKTVTSRIPDTLQALLTACPILMFTGWLIGRVR